MKTPIKRLLTFFTLFGLLWSPGQNTSAESLEDQVLIRKGQPLFLKDGTMVRCERFWWIIQSADFVQCDKGTMAEDIQVEDIDLDRTFGPGTADRYREISSVKSDKPTPPPHVTTLESGGPDTREDAGKQGEPCDASQAPPDWLQDSLHKLASSDMKVVGNELLALLKRRHGPFSMPLIPPLIDLLSNETRGRVFVSGGLSSNIPSSETRIGDVAGETLKRIGTCAVDHLHRALGRYPSGKPRHRILWCLAAICDPRSYPVMSQAFQREEEHHHRRAALHYFGRLKDPTVLPILHRALSNEEPRIQAAVAKSLGEIGSRESVEPLIRVMQDSQDNTVRRVAAQSLGEIGDPRAVEALIQAGKDDRNKGKWGEYVEQAVDSALSPSAGKEFVHALGEALSGADLGMRLSAAKALAGLKDAEKIPHLVRALQSDTNDEVRRLAVWGLQGHRTPLVEEALIRAIHTDSSPVIRRSAAQQLRFFGDPLALEAVATAVRKDKSTDVRIAALSSLYAMVDHNGLKRRTLEHVAQNDVDQKVRNSATNLLNRL